MKDKSLLSHPKSLYVLSLAEAWNRFSYYGIQALLVLYLTKAFLFTDNHAYGLYGIFTALAMAAPILGGILADRLLGGYHSVAIGAALIVVSNLVLAMHGTWALYTGLAIGVMGIGLFKANCASMVGTLYENNPAKREAGITILYIGMNIGALLGPIVYAYIAFRFSWQLSFFISAFGMLISLAIILLSSKQLKSCEKITRKIKSASTNILISLSIIIAGAVFLALMAYPHLFRNLLAIAGAIAVAYLYLTASKSNRLERNHIYALGLLAFFSIFFFACSLQNATSLTLFLDRDVDRYIFGWQLPTMAFIALQPFFIILAAPLIAIFWQKYNSRYSAPSPFIKVAIGILLAAISFGVFAIAAYLSTPTSHIALGCIVLGNLLIGVGELCLFPAVLSAIAQFSPQKLRGTLMGALFLSLAFSGYLASVLAKLTSSVNLSITHHDNYFKPFCLIGCITLMIGIAVILLAPKLNRLLFTETEPMMVDNLAPAKKSA